MSNVFASPNGDLETMPFGEHKGLPLDQVETGYLKWWLRKMDSDDLRSEYRESVLAVLAARGTAPPKPYTPKPSVGVASAKLMFAAEVRCVIKAWFGQMVKRYHPDRGGTNEAQMVVTECYKALMDELVRWETSRQAKENGS